MAARSEGDRAARLACRFSEVRDTSVRQCASLPVEDYVVQSMPDASPLKWHLAHTTWFFEVFVLAEFDVDFRPFDERWGELHNSYYEALGRRHPRAKRGLLTRPTVEEVLAYRAATDARVLSLLERFDEPEGNRCLDRVELGIHHEQQHQELMWTDLQHALSLNPLAPVAMPLELRSAEPSPLVASWVEHPGGLAGIGHTEAGFAFDNEGPSHRVFLEPFALSSLSVTAGEFAEFIADGGYERPEHWLSDGFETVRREGWSAPLYWERRGQEWFRHSLHGAIPVDPLAAVAHVSFYEADAYARWHGARLPTEAEWESVVGGAPGASSGQFVEDGWLVPRRARRHSFFGGVWTWTSSPYSPYPGFAPERGAVGEYNGKFMANQFVLRGGSCLSARSHVRATYRNFFPPHARWQATGIRLARRGTAR